MTTAGGALRLTVDRDEAAVLRRLVAEVRDRLDAEPTPGGQPDPARARLLPDAHRDDPALAAAHRDLTEAGLIADKRADAELVAAQLPVAGGTVELTDPHPWLRALNDVRLTLGAELAITEDSEPPRQVATEADLRLSVYFWVTYVQDSLVSALLALPSDGAGRTW
ncbi:MAG: DUF2017 family protein [Geodermatophilaceae bacterium]